VLSVSGGEPFLYAPLSEVAAEASRLGYHVTVVTNGAAVTEAKAASVCSAVRTAAVSIEGRPQHHDAIRRKAGAFDLAIRGFRHLSAVGITTGMIACVTRSSLPDVPWLHELARAERASLLQLRPLALTGRASTTLDSEALDRDDVTRLAVVAALLGDTDDLPFVQCDLAPVRELLTSGPAQFALLDGDAPAAPLSTLVNPLVVAEDGSVRPFAYNVAERYHLSTIDALAAGRWEVLPPAAGGRLARLLRQTFAIIADRDAHFVDWYATLTDTSHRVASPQLCSLG